MTKIYNYEVLKDAYTKIQIAKSCKLDPLLIKEYQKATLSINNYDWENIKDKFIENLNFVFTIDEQLIFTILSFKLKEEFLNKDPNFCEELCSILALSNINTQKIIPYAKIILDNKVYSTIAEIIIKNPEYYYSEILEKIIKILDNEDIYTTNEVNSILKKLYRLQEKRYAILIEESDSLKEIYSKIHFIMLKENKKAIVYTQKNFEILKILLEIDESFNEDFKQSIKELFIEIDDKNDDEQLIIREILNALNHIRMIDRSLTRRK